MKEKEKKKKKKKPLKIIALEDDKWYQYEWFV